MTPSLNLVHACSLQLRGFEVRAAFLFTRVATSQGGASGIVVPGVLYASFVFAGSGGDEVFCEGAVALVLSCYSGVRCPVTVCECLA